MTTSNKHNSSPVSWEIIDESLHADCRIYKVYKRHCKHPGNGKEGDFFVIKSPDWVHAIPLTSDDELVLVKQFRFGSEQLSLELPGGLCNENESIVEAAVRELKEETGYVGSNPQIIASCWPNPAIQNNHAHFVLLKNCQLKENTQWDQHEELQLHVIPIKNVFQMVIEGTINHAITLNALFYLKLYLDSNASPASSPINA